MLCIAFGNRGWITNNIYFKGKIINIHDVFVLGNRQLFISFLGLGKPSDLFESQFLHFNIRKLF